MGRAALVDELTAEGRGISPNTDLQLWSCFAGGRVQANPSLVESVHKALEQKNIGNVRVSGVVGTSWTNTARGQRFSGAEEGSAADMDLDRLQMHFLVEVGLMPYGHAKRFRLVSLNRERELKYGKPGSSPPATVDDAIQNLEAAGKLRVTMAQLSADRREEEAPSGALQELRTKTS